MVPLQSTSAGHPQQKDRDHPEYPDLSRSLAWLDYRTIWRLSELENAKHKEIFDLLLNEIIPGCLFGSGVVNTTYFEKWVDILNQAKLKPTKSGGARGYAKVAKLESNIKSFNTNLEGFLIELENKANELLVEFDPFTKIKLEYTQHVQYNSSSRRNKFTKGRILLKLKYKSKLVDSDPINLLNEARLTSVGVCLFLAGISNSLPHQRPNSTYFPRTLVLDDVLMSLDMANRLPFIDLLNKHFADWQVLILTHDRSWFEICKRRLPKWHHNELFNSHLGNHNQPVLRKGQDHLEHAKNFLDQGHLKAAAVHIRTKYEIILKESCSNLSLRVKYNADPLKVSAKDFWEAIKEKQIDIYYPFKKPKNKPPKVEAAISKTRTRFLSEELINTTEHSLSWVMNPLSHDHDIDTYRSEIEGSIQTLVELNKTLQTYSKPQPATTAEEKSKLLRRAFLRILQAKASTPPAKLKTK